MRNTGPTIIERVFLSPAENRLRAGWRLTLQTSLLLAIAIAATFIFSAFPGFIRLDPDGSILSGLVETIAVTVSVALACVWLDKRPLSHLGLKLDKKVIPDILTGILISFFLMGVILGVESAAGWLKFSGLSEQAGSGWQIASSLGLILIVFIGVGWNEELLSRGYHLQTLASGMNLFWGVFISSSIFGILHLANPNSENKIMVAVGILAAGLFLAYGYLRTGQLWLSIGLHIGWNFFEGPIFSFPVSGTRPFHLFNITVNGPQIWTGGGFGPEAGLIVFPVLALGILLTYLYTLNRKLV